MNNLCNNCIHKDVCSRWTATWGMKSCENFMEMPKKGKWEHTLEGGYYQARCTACGQIAIKADYNEYGSFTIKWPYCPNCGADMIGAEDGL